MMIMNNLNIESFNDIIDWIIYNAPTIACLIIYIVVEYLKNKGIIAIKDIPTKFKYIENQNNYINSIIEDINAKYDLILKNNEAVKNEINAIENDIKRKNKYDRRY